MAKEFLYRGKTLDELKSMSLTEFSELLPSQQRRKIKKGFTDEEKKFVEKIRKKDNVKTHLRTMIILPEMVGKTVKIHNGKSFELVLLQEEMVGHYLGEFSLTRKRSAHNAPGVGATRSSSAISVR